MDSLLGDFWWRRVAWNREAYRKVSKQASMEASNYASYYASTVLAKKTAQHKKGYF